MAMSDLKRRTTERYGLLWARDDPKLAITHFEGVSRLLSLRPPVGRILDAGCGEGLDTLAMSCQAGAEVVALDLTEEGVRRTLVRAGDRGNVHAVQGDLESLPFPDATFDFVYSYGVLHHLPQPESGLKELVRVLKPGEGLAIYVYEDFEDRTAFERWVLHGVNRFRVLTVRIKPLWLWRLCQVASPFIYVGLTLPARLLACVPGLRRFSQRIPYHHGTGPFSMVGDLYDRFAAPIEKRYSHAHVREWLAQAGLTAVTVRFMRGWVAHGTKPASGDQRISESSRMRPAATFRVFQ